MFSLNRRLIIIIASALVLVALLFPPWIAYRAATAGVARSTGFGISPNPGYRIPIGWHFILSTPESRRDSVALDWSRLALELMLIGVAGGLALYLVKE